MAQYDSLAPHAAVNALFRKVYQYMTLGLILTSLTAWLISSPSMLRMFETSLASLIIVVIVEIGFVVYITATMEKYSASTLLLLFVIYSILNGITCSVVLLFSTDESVYTEFLPTALMFVAMSVYATYTKRDITARGSFLLMGFLGLIIALVINMLVGSSLAVTVISVVGIIIFTVLTAYDTAKIKTLAERSNMNDDETAGKVTVTGALGLYLDFINMFLYLLFIYLVRLFWKKRD